MALSLRGIQSIALRPIHFVLFVLYGTMGFIGACVIQLHRPRHAPISQPVFPSLWLAFSPRVLWFFDFIFEHFAAERPSNYLICHQQCVFALRRITVLIMTHRSSSYRWSGVDHAESLSIWLRIKASFRSELSLRWAKAKAGMLPRGPDCIHILCTSST